MRQTIKRLLPAPVYALYRKFLIAKLRAANKHMTTREVFTRIYQQKKWSSSSASIFQSGSGSIDTIANSYADYVNAFIAAKGIKSVVDLGCGDYNVGSRLHKDPLTYTGVDIVADLIAYNQQHFADSHTAFEGLDIVYDDLPPADLCLIRQVFQHLSNQQILAVLNKLGQYRYILISEHYPADHVRVIPNRDKPHGEDTRIYDQSAVYLDAAPFHQKNIQLVLEVEAEPLVNPSEKIKTFLLDNSTSDSLA